MAGAWIPYGKIVRAHGVRGELRLRPYDVDSDFPEAATCVQLVAKDGAARQLGVQAVRPIHQAVLVTLDEVSSREDAKALVGSEVAIARADLDALEPGEFYLFELEGAAVSDEDGEAIGEVEAVVHLAGQDLLTLRGPRGRCQLPIGPDTVRRFDRAAGTLTVRMIDGLWESP